MKELMGLECANCKAEIPVSSKVWYEDPETGEIYCGSCWIECNECRKKHKENKNLVLPLGCEKVQNGSCCIHGDHARNYTLYCAHCKEYDEHRAGYWLSRAEDGGF